MVVIRQAYFSNLFYFSVYKHSTVNKAYKDGMEVNCKYVKRKQLTQYLSQEVLDKYKSSYSTAATDANNHTSMPNYRTVYHTTTAAAATATTTTTTINDTSTTSVEDDTITTLATTSSSSSSTSNDQQSHHKRKSTDHHNQTDGSPSTGVVDGDVGGDGEQDKQPAVAAKKMKTKVSSRSTYGILCIV